MSTDCVSSNLVMYDMKKFLDKYTRFMTKDIYISKELYDNFLGSYDYLYKMLEKDAVLYRENAKYKKIIEIKNNSKKLLKLHNQKYLKKNVGKYNDFFNRLNIDSELDLNQKYVVLSNEDKMLVVGNKNVNSLVVAKIKYLIDILKVKQDKILVLVDNNELRNLFIENNLNGVVLEVVSNYKNRLINNDKILTNEEKSRILINYIINDLFLKKDEFSKLYNAFSNNIYLNDDYLKFDTFSDYHNYLYKKKFLSSKLSIGRFVKKEIDVRKKYLRTIKNELVSMKEEVEVANYLFINDINYKYDNNVFYIDGKCIKVISDGVKIDFDENIIYINSELVNNDLFKEILNSEFNIKDVNKINYEYIYDMLKDSMIDNYFGLFVNKYLISYLEHYEKMGNYDNTKLNSEQKNVLISIYNYYKCFIKDKGLVDDNDVDLLLKDDINSKKYKYILVNSKICLNLIGNVIRVVDDYENVNLIKENIKLLYDYKRYLQDNKLLVASNLYIDNKEIDRLTNSFLKENLNIINDCFVNNEKRVSIYFYDDSNRLKVNKNIAKECYEIIRRCDDVLIGVNNVSNINTLVYKDCFTKVGKNKLSIDDKREVKCESVLNLKKSYGKIILPFLIVDSYHEDLICDVDYVYKIKLMMYISLSKCRDELILLCPKGKKNELIKLSKKIKNVVVFE